MGIPKWKRKSREVWAEEDKGSQRPSPGECDWFTLCSAVPASLPRNISLLTLHSHPGDALGCDVDLPGPCLWGVIYGNHPELPKVVGVAQRPLTFLLALGDPWVGVEEQEIVT